MGQPQSAHGADHGAGRESTACECASQRQFHHDTPARRWRSSRWNAQTIEFELSFKVLDFGSAATAKHGGLRLHLSHARAAGLRWLSPRNAAALVGLPQTA